MAETNPLRTLIVDDEPLAIERLQILSAQIPLLRLVGTANNGEAALRLVEALEPDLLLLDIGMPNLTGIEVASALEKRKCHSAVIFVTAYDQFAVPAFEIGAVDYLLKPVHLDRLTKAINRVKAQLDVGPGLPAQGPAQEFWVPHRAQIIRIPVDEIDLIEAERDYMRLHAGERSYLMHETITELERRLDPAVFIRIHRSAIVRRQRIAALKHDGGGSWQAELSDGRLLRIGRTYLSSVRAILGR